MCIRDSTGVTLPAKGSVLPLGKGRILREGTSIAILNFGTRLTECLKAAEELGHAGLSTTVADARFMKPLDTDLVERLAREHEVLITVEEGAVGGFASHVPVSYTHLDVYKRQVRGLRRIGGDAELVHQSRQHELARYHAD